MREAAAYWNDALQAVQSHDSSVRESGAINKQEDSQDIQVTKISGLLLRVCGSAPTVSFTEAQR